MPEVIHIKQDSFEIRVWYLSEGKEELCTLIHITDNEHIKISNFKNELAVKSFLCLRIMLQKMSNETIQYASNGKPLLEKGHVSLSHSGHWCATMYSEKAEIGIDVEKIDSRILKIKDRFLSQEEQTDICGGEIKNMILGWSAKEAVFKKFGRETVYFKENQKILNIDTALKLIDLEITIGKMKQVVQLAYEFPSEEYVLVYTL